MKNQKAEVMTDLHCQITGNGTPLVLIHGGGTDSRIWTDLSDKLSENYKVITYDLRGHGKSPVPTTKTNHVKDLHILFKSLNINKAIIVGHSLGGQIGVDFSLLYPEKVDQLVLIAPGLTGFKYGESFESMSQKLWKAVPDIDLMLQIMLHSPEAYAMQESMKSEHKKVIEKIHRENIEKSLNWKNFEQEWTEGIAANRLHELQSATLFIMGSEDKQDIFKIRTLFKSVPNINFEEIEGGDHGIVLTHGEEILRHIYTFIR